MKASLCIMGLSARLAAQSTHTGLIAEELSAVRRLISCGDTSWLSTISVAGRGVLKGTSVSAILVSVDDQGNWWVRDLGGGRELQRIRGTSRDRFNLEKAMQQHVMFNELMDFSKGLLNHRDIPAIRRFSERVNQLPSGPQKDRLRASIGTDLLSLTVDDRNVLLSDTEIGPYLETALQAGKQVDVARADAIQAGDALKLGESTYGKWLFADLAELSPRGSGWTAVGENTYVADTRGAVRWYAKTDPSFQAISPLSQSQFTRLTREGKIKMFYGLGAGSEVYLVNPADIAAGLIDPGSAVGVPRK